MISQDKMIGFKHFQVFIDEVAQRVFEIIRHQRQYLSLQTVRKTDALILCHLVLQRQSWLKRTGVIGVQLRKMIADIGGKFWRKLRNDLCVLLNGLRIAVSLN